MDHLFGRGCQFFSQISVLLIHLFPDLCLFLMIYKYRSDTAGFGICHLGLLYSDYITGYTLLVHEK